MSDDDKKSYSVPEPSEVPEDPTLPEFFERALKKREANAAKGREIRKELRQMERELIAGGLLDKHWRDSFLSIGVIADTP